MKLEDKVHELLTSGEKLSAAQASKLLKPHVPKDATGKAWARFFRKLADAVEQAPMVYELHPNQLRDIVRDAIKEMR
jgi:hypothetical protein